MKRHLTKAICSALLGVAIAGSSLTGVAQAQVAGSMSAPLINAAPAESAVAAEAVNHRYGRRHHRRGHRYHRRGGGGAGIYFHFGTPGPRYAPRYRRHQPRHARGSRHVRWCHNRYKSYRAWDNTFQPYKGPRKQCWSPYN